MISIIISAFNEEKVIQRTLLALETGINSGEFQVIVVCNGCIDNTSKIVRSFNEKILCIELKQASKTMALNKGNEVAHYFPRVYLDADTQIDYQSVLALTEPLKDDRYLGASPVIGTNLCNASHWVKLYYNAWLTLPYCRKGQVWAGGAYGLSRLGQQRVGKYPPIIADDSYACFSFKPEERIAVQQAHSIITPPKSLYWLIKVLTRVRVGSNELFQKFPEFKKNQQPKTTKTFSQWLSSDTTIFAILLYTVVNVITRILANWHIRRKGFTGWARDESSRE